MWTNPRILSSSAHEEAARTPLADPHQLPLRIDCGRTARFAPRTQAPRRACQKLAGGVSHRKIVKERPSPGRGDTQTAICRPPTFHWKATAPSRSALNSQPKCASTFPGRTRIIVAAPFRRNTSTFSNAGWSNTMNDICGDVAGRHNRFGTGTNLLSPLPGLTSLFARFRWLTPPANFYRPAGPLFVRFAHL